MKWKSVLVSELSGSMAGITASTSRGGVGYFRERVTPSNPSTQLQLATRSALASVSVYWNTVLSEADQEAWWDIAEGSQTGQTIFNRANQPRIYATNSGRTTGVTGTYAGFTMPLVLTPPESQSTSFTTPTGIVIDDSSNTLVFVANADDPWNSETILSDQAAFLAVYASHQQSASRFAQQHSYSMLAAVVREEAAAAVATVTINLATHGFTTQAGKVMYLKFQAHTQDGRTSVPIELRATIVA